MSAFALSHTPDRNKSCNVAGAVVDYQKSGAAGFAVALRVVLTLSQGSGDGDGSTSTALHTKYTPGIKGHRTESCARRASGFRHQGQFHATLRSFTRIQDTRALLAENKPICGYGYYTHVEYTVISRSAASFFYLGDITSRPQYLHA